MIEMVETTHAGRLASARRRPRRRLGGCQMGGAGGTKRRDNGPAFRAPAAGVAGQRVFALSAMRQRDLPTLRVDRQEGSKDRGDEQ